MRFKNEILLILAMLVWSAAWTSGKLVANSAPPALTLFWRYIFSCAALLPFFPLLHESLHLSRRQLLWTFFSAAIMTAYSWLFFFGLKTGYAGAAGVLVTALNPIFTYFLQRLIFRQVLTGRDKAGLLLGVVGGVILLEVWALSEEKILLSGNLLFLACALIYAFVTLATNATTKIVSTFVYSFYVNLFGAILLLPFIYNHFSETPPLQDFNYWGNIFFLGVISNGFATTVYFYAVKNLGSAKASSYIFIVPAAALWMAAVYLGEPVNTTTIVGGVLALAAVALLLGVRVPTKRGRTAV
ncbi:MAG TPA: DMT family transporter [Turneriella sp.]|nr:DMT family transporter [Turneriella sp.]